jgi:hypothetical protein
MKNKHQQSRLAAAFGVTHSLLIDNLVRVRLGFSHACAY